MKLVLCVWMTILSVVFAARTSVSVNNSETGVLPAGIPALQNTTLTFTSKLTSDIQLLRYSISQSDGTSNDLSQKLLDKIAGRITDFTESFRNATKNLRPTVRFGSVENANGSQGNCDEKFKNEMSQRFLSLENLIKNVQAQLEVNKKSAESAAKRARCPQNFTTDISRQECMKLEVDYRIWTAGRQVCKEYGGDLAKLDTHAKLRFAARVAIVQKLSYVGATTSSIGGPWAWVDGSPVDPYLWAPGQPDNPGMEECAVLDSTNVLLYNVDCNLRGPIICEINVAN